MSEAETLVTPPATGTPAAASVNSSDWIKVAAAQLVEAGDESAEPAAEPAKEEPEAKTATDDKAEPKSEPEAKADPKEEVSKELAEARKVKAEAIKMRADLLKAQRRNEERKLQLEAAAKQNEAIVQEARTLLQRLKTEPYRVVEEMGGSFADWQQRHLSGADTAGGPTPRQIQESLPQMLEQMKASILAEMKQATEPLLQERKRSQEDAMVTQYKSALREKLAADPLIQRYGIDRAMARAIKAADEHAARTGEALDSSELSEQTIRELLEEARLLGAETGPKPTPAARPNGGTKRTPDNAASSTRATRDPAAAQSRDEWIKEAARQLREAQGE